MGIVNVTPDSFSDGGRFVDRDAAVQHGLQLLDAGADILDIGGESTRPYSSPVDVEEELRRTVTVLQDLAQQTTVPLSIDTSKAIVAQAAMDAGAEIINDVTGLCGDPQMVSFAAQSNAGVCVMHMQGTPQTMQDNPTYKNVVRDILEYLKSRRDALQQLGIPAERIALDPGIGFGKTHRHNVELLAAAEEFHQLGCPLLFGHSRKGFIGKVLGNSEVDRDAGTIGVALALARSGVQVIRVHNVAHISQALRLFESVGGIDGSPRLIADA